MSYIREYVIVCFSMLLALPNGIFHQEAEDIHNQWFEVYCQKCMQCYHNCAKEA